MWHAACKMPDTRAFVAPTVFEKVVLRPKTREIVCTRSFEIMKVSTKNRFISFDFVDGLMGPDCTPL